MTPSAAVRTSDRPTLVYLHALGSSRDAFIEVASRLTSTFDVLGLDLPGFGDEAPRGAATVEEIVEFVVSRIAFASPSRWLLVGHSMGGKIASLVAARALSGEAPVFGLAGVVLLAGSPVSPEPMEEERRQRMIGWAESGPVTGEDARTFISANTAGPLPPSADALVVRDLARTDASAWVAWLRRGSEEDWSASVEPLELPALIVSGSDDGDLGPQAQTALNGPLYPRARFEVIEGAAHLLPLEKPDEIAAVIASFWGEVAGVGPAVPRGTAALIASSHTSARTRGILARRSVADDPSYSPQVLTVEAFRTLRAVADRVVPQEGEQIDLAARLDAQLHAGTGDGWRNAGLPADREAYALALEGLHGFEELPADEQDERLRAVADSRWEPPGARLSPSQFADWFEDARADLARHWLAHPASMARVGFDGFATGGDGVRKQGFQLLAAGTREAWEPRPGGAPGRARHAAVDLGSSGAPGGDAGSMLSHAPSHGAPSHGAPSHGAPSHGAPSHGAPSAGAPSAHSASAAGLRTGGDASADRVGGSAGATRASAGNEGGAEE
ncbi:alpha/beta hydrolase [Herbiconiux liangxiaofengii]|uniref:alpha/beta hydrolase n=1 Tax=Herbiconiux liangxiaofengii TaxID=3342795 RepID=UPI0035B9F9D1